MTYNKRIFEIGKIIFSKMNQSGPTLMSKSWWESQLMELSMKNESFKVKMFHFVDVFPTLDGSKEIARHFNEYFPTLEGVPTLFKAGMALAKTGIATNYVISKAAQIGIKQMAKGFIAGSNAKEATKVVDKMRKKGFGFTMDVLGEATVNEIEAEQYTAIYQELIAVLSQHSKSWHPNSKVDGEGEFLTPGINLSIKLSSLYSQMSCISPDKCVEALKNRLRPILKLAKDNNIAMNIDQEQFDYRDIITRTFMELMDEPEFKDYPFAGIVVQAYLRDSKEELLMLTEWAKTREHPIYIRLVKGAYWDYETVISAQKHIKPPVFTQKWMSDKNFEECSEILLENYKYTRPAFASHNVRSISAAMAIAESKNIPKQAYEFQVLFGMGDSIASSLCSEGCRCRVYSPYGEMIPGMGYLVRRLLENTANDSFLLQTLEKNRDEDALLQEPSGPAEEKLPHIKEGFCNTPEVDWTVSEEREKMQQAIKQVRGELGKTYPLIINGERIVTENLRDSVNPANPSEIIGKVSQADGALAEKAIAVARAAFPSWRDAPAESRAEVLIKGSEIAKRRKFELAAWMVLEAGKTWNEAISDVEETIDYLSYYAHEMLRMSKPRRMGSVPGETNDYFYEGKGVGIIISPWNFPLAICAGMSISAIVTGNTIIMKPANVTPVIAMKLMEILEEAGLPKGVANFLPGSGGKIGDVLVRSPETNFVAFTGSQEVGLHICKAAAETPGKRQGPKRVIAEMGGKNAVIVDSDADLDEAVVGVVKAAFGYSGQKCSACSRVVVLESIYDLFCKRLADAVNSIIVGPGEDSHTLVNPVIDANAQKTIKEYIEIGKKEGRVIVERDLGELEDKGYYVPPTVIADIDQNARIVQEEIFGPVLAVIKAKDIDDAIEIANNSDFALTGGLFSRSPENIKHVKRNFHVGNFYINRTNTGAIVERQPFGGFKMSGIGSKAGGPDYLIQFVNPRTVTENTLRRGFAPKESDS